MPDPTKTVRLLLTGITLLLLPLHPSKGQAQALVSDLIPRENFFKDALYTDVKLNRAGTVFYFRRTDQPDKIYLKSVVDAYLPMSKNLDSIWYPAPVREYVPTTAGVVCIWNDSEGKPHISLGFNEVETPFKAKSIRIIKHPSYDDETPLNVVAENEEESGLYVFYGYTEMFVYKQPMPEQCTNGCFLDFEFNIVAGVNRNENGANTLYYVSPKDTSWQKIEDHDWSAAMFIGGFSNIVSASLDGEWVYYTTEKNSDKSQLFKINRNSGERIKLAESEKVDLLPFGASVTMAGDVTSVVGLYARTVRFNLNEEAKNDFDYLSNELKADISFAQSAGDDRVWLVRTFRGAPMTFYVFDRDTKRITPLLTDYPYLKTKAMASRTAFEVTSHDGMKLPVHVYLPVGSDQNFDGIPDKPLPTILYVHGGPWVGIVHWNQFFHWRNLQLLANRGYAVINCEFRGTTGLGKDVTMKSKKKWGTSMTKDITSIAHWAKSKKIADPEKTGIWGWSYGGYAAMAGLAFAPKTYACGVSMYGISDLEAFGKIPFANNDWWKRMLGNPESKNDAKIQASHSPINYVKKIKAPLLLTTGSKDERVPQVQVDNMAAEMVKRRKDVVYFYYPEEVHDYRDPNSWISFWAITEQFLQQHLGGQAQPVGNDVEKGNLVFKEGKEWLESVK